MESSLAVFLKRQLACELLPTCGLGHVGIGIAFAGSGVPWCHVAAILPAVRGQAPVSPPPPRPIHTALPWHTTTATAARATASTRTSHDKPFRHTAQ